MSEFYSIITDEGLKNLVDSKALGENISLTHFAVGDSLGDYYEPQAEQTSLYNELYRAELNQVYNDPDYPFQIIIEATIPEETGGFFIREVGIFDENGNLFAIAKYPITYKPNNETGSGKDLYIRMTLAFSSTANISLYTNPYNSAASIKMLEDYALKDFSNVADENKSHQQWGDLQGGSETERYHLTQAQSLLVESLKLLINTDNKDKSVAINSDGTGITIKSIEDVCNTLLTSYALKDFSNVADATETIKGIIQLATSTEALAGTNDAKAITPLKAKNIIDTNNTSLASLYATQTSLATTNTNLSSHTGNVSNPHSVTKSQVGLGNCDNTSDVNKPISTATQTVLDTKQVINLPITTLATSGTISLSDNSINRISPTATITFSLPSVSDHTYFHQILVQVYLSTTITINLGTSVYFSGEAPEFEAGRYNIIYEHNGTDWVVGAILVG
ncbi:MAG: phage tail protein [Alphaproteobacteria bacterium]